MKKTWVYCYCKKEDRWSVNPEPTALLRNGTITLNENCCTWVQADWKPQFSKTIWKNSSSVQNSKDYIISSEASQANLNFKKRILIQQPFLHWVHFGGKFQVTSEMQSKHGICTRNTDWKNEGGKHKQVGTKEHREKICGKASPFLSIQHPSGSLAVINYSRYPQRWFSGFSKDF